MSYELEFNKLSVEIVDENYGIHKINYMGYNSLCIYKGIYRNYINATKLTKDGGKLFKNWLRNDKSESLIQYLENEVIPNDDVLAQKRASEANVRIVALFELEDVHNDLRGIYVHPDLLPPILCWISDEFAIKVSRIINKYAISQKDEKIFSELELANEKLEESHAINERNEDELTVLTQGIKNLSVNNIKKDQYCSASLNRQLAEVIVISTVNYILNNVKKRIIIVNKCQRRSYKGTRNGVIQRFFKKTDNVSYTKCDPFIVPFLILEDPNVVKMWASFKYYNQDKITVENSIITIKVKGFKLISEISKHVGVQIKPVEQLQKEYEELLNMKDDDEVIEDF
jgi:hypothetical protein